MSQNQPLLPVKNEGENDGKPDSTSWIPWDWLPSLFQQEEVAGLERTENPSGGNGFGKTTERSLDTEHRSKTGTGKMKFFKSASMPAGAMEHLAEAASFGAKQKGHVNLEEEHIVSVDEQLAEDGKWSLHICAVAMLAYLLIGQMIGIHQGWSPIVSFYFTVVTFTTVGYGDFDFEGESSEWQYIGALFILLGIIIFGATWTTMFTRVFRADQDEVRAFSEYRSAVKEQDPVLQGSVRPSRLRTWLRTKFLQSHPEPLWSDYSEASKLQSLEHHNLIQIKVSCAVATAKVLILVLGMTLVMRWFEGWSYAKCLYWAVTTASTVGYGDVIPETESGRLLTTVLIVSSVGLCSEALGVLASFRSVQFETRARHRVLAQFGTTLTQEEFNTLAHGEEMRELGLSRKDSEVTKAEFCIFLLTKLGRVSKEELTACQAAFARLDLTHTGTLDYKDLARHEEIRMS